MIKRSTKPIKPGRKTRNWNNARRKLKKQSVEMNILFCEFRFEGCRGEIDGYSHPKKRRFTKESELMENVVGCCNFCHQTIESHPEKLRLHREAIERRESLRYESA